MALVSVSGARVVPPRQLPPGVSIACSDAVADERGRRVSSGRGPR